jgi:hypothetical protein
MGRKEVRGETSVLKKVVTSYRAEIAALKRRAGALSSSFVICRRPTERRRLRVTERGHP